MWSLTRVAFSGVFVQDLSVEEDDDVAVDEAGVSSRAVSDLVAEAACRLRSLAMRR